MSSQKQYADLESRAEVARERGDEGLALHYESMIASLSADDDGDGGDE